MSTTLTSDAFLMPENGASERKANDSGGGEIAQTLEASAQDAGEKPSHRKIKTGVKADRVGAGSAPPDGGDNKAPRPLYAAREKIYSKRAHGTFRNLKWFVMAVTLGIYYLLPWVRWERGPTLPNQAFLLDFEHQRLFFGPLEIWAQEFYLVTGVLVVSALALFLFTSLLGRVWCGYACPQTVWTDLMIAVERFWQGDRNARMRLDRQPWNIEKIWKKSATHSTWLLISLATGGVWVFYFRDAPTLAVEFVTGTAPAIAYTFLIVFTFTTYVLGGLAREQVCIYMCPWPRIQGAMFDRDTLLVGYRGWRGEPRGPHKSGQSWEGRGDCVDCKQCVAVCPTGIDIRNGPQLECIQCALCIDACNEIMDKVGRPRGLIAYDSFRNSEAIVDKRPLFTRFMRPRTFIYSGLMAVVGGLMIYALASRDILEVNVLRDRNPLYVQLADGGVRNGYTMKVLNKRHAARRFAITIEGLPDARASVVGQEDLEVSEIEVAPDSLREVRVYVSLTKEQLRTLTSEATEFKFVVTDIGFGSSNNRTTTFRKP